LSVESKASPRKALHPANLAGAAADAPSASLMSIPAWRVACLAFGAGAAALFALFHDTVAATVGTWISNTTFNHGFLILPICVYLAWQRRAELARMMPEPTAWALVPLAASGAGWLLGAAASVNVVQQFCLLFMLWSLFLAVFGWRVSRYLIFPLGYAAFAVPFGTFLVPPLQDFTAAFTVRGIELVGIPVYVDGYLISLPNGSFEVAEACAGIRFLIATLALGFLFAELTYRSYWRKALFLALCVVVPIVSNGLRAFAVVLVGDLSNMTVAVGFDHIVYGWLLFAIVTVILLAVGMTFRDRDLNETPPAPASATGRPRPSPARIAALAAGAVVLAAVYPAYAELVVRAVPAERPIALATPEIGNGWRPVSTAQDDWRPDFPGADATLMRSYAKDGRIVRLFIAYYRYQRGGAEVVSSANLIADGKSWRRLGWGSAEAPVEGRTRRVDSERIARGDRRLLVWGWHWIDNVFTADPYLSKFLQTKAKLLHETPAAAHVAVATQFEPGSDAAAEALRDFLASAKPLRPILSSAAAR
jgi:exosortase A